MCLQEAFQEARKVELSVQAGLMSMYLDLGGYHTHHRNAQLELFFLRAKMHRAQAEAAVYTLALENSPASTYSDSGERNLVAVSLMADGRLQIQTHHRAQLCRSICQRKCVITWSAWMPNQ